MSKYNLASFQRSRWRQSLLGVLRAALGRDIPSSELESRTAGYLTGTDRRSLGAAPTPDSSPLLRASDYAPRSEDDPLGGEDGLGLGRAWAAGLEDLDIVEEALAHAESRLATLTTRVRSQDTALSGGFDALDAQSSALMVQVQAPFFGGAAAGTARKVWAVTAGQGFRPAQTTASLVGPFLCLPSRAGNGAGGTVAQCSVRDCSDALAFGSLAGRAWAESPLGGGIAWTFAGSVTATLSLSFPCTLLELVLGAGTVVSGPLGQTVSAGGTTWISVPPSDSVTLSLSYGSISSFQAHAPLFDAEAEGVWGPLSLPDSADGLYALGLGELSAAVPPGTALAWDVSTVGPDGPWSPATFGSPLVLRANAQNTVDLRSASPDVLSLGYYVFPLSAASSVRPAVFSAGQGQAKVSAYQYDWAQEKDPLHAPHLSDWDSPKGVVRTVPMGSGPPVHGERGTSPAWTAAERLSAGSCLGAYSDDHDWSTRALTALTVTGPDPANPSVLRPGHNYRFSWAVYAADGAYLPSVPVGFWAPDGVPGRPACPFSLCINGASVYQADEGFSDYRELSGPPAGFGTLPAQYGSGRGTALPSGPAGAAWPPYCGRMNVTLRPGWNTIEVLLYVPTQTALGRCAALVFGPDLLSDTATLEDEAGISEVRGWRDEWPQSSEFDLRLSAPAAVQEAWSWKSGANGEVVGVLLNHDPAASETGAVSLDGALSGSVRAHRITYAAAARAASSVSPGADPDPRQVWVRATLTTSDPAHSPFVSAFSVTAN